MRAGLDTEPVFPCLSVPMVVFGVEWRLFTGNAMVLVFMAMSLKVFWWVVPAVAAHLVLWYATRQDADMLGVYVAYAGQAARYEPHPVADMRQGMRPVGMGRGVLA